MNIYGYIHVGAREQDEAGQLVALRENGVLDRNIYIDRQPEEGQERPQYKRLLQKLKKKDLLYLQSISHLGRSYKEILEQWRVITQDTGANVVVLDMPLLDTRRDKSLKGTFLSDIILHLLAYEAENTRDCAHRQPTQKEQDLYRRRQAEGIAAAKAKGVRFGRPPAPLPDNFHEVRRAWCNKEVTLSQAAELCGMPKGTFYSKAVKLEKRINTTTDTSWG